MSTTVTTATVIRSDHFSPHYPTTPTKNGDTNKIVVIFLQAKVMRKQLLILHNSLAAYFSGNKEELEKTMKEFHVRVMSKGEGTSFLETH